MNQLTVKALKQILSGMKDDDVIYLGDDEELNGVHEAFFCQEMSGNELSSISYGSITKGGVLIS